MEQVSILNKRGSALSGILHKCDHNKIIILVHGYGGDKSENGLFDLTAGELFSEKFSVLQFDFRGCGESDNSFLRMDYLLDDLNCVINYVKTKKFRKVGLLGYSLGGLLSIKALSENVNSLVLWSPLTNSINLKKRYSICQWNELEKNGFLVLEKFKKNRSQIVVHKSLVEELNNINQKELLHNVKTPTLFVHGEKDDIISVDESKNAVDMIQNNSKLIIVEGENHYLKNKISVFIKHSLDWFKRTLED